MALISINPSGGPQSDIPDLGDGSIIERDVGPTVMTNMQAMERERKQQIVLRMGKRVMMGDVLRGGPIRKGGELQ